MDGNKARLESDNLRAEVDLLNPAGGVSVLAVEGAIANDITLFRVRLPRSTSDSNVDSFARGNDLIATYSETADNPFRAQIYWRFLPSAMSLAVEDDRGDPSPARATALELIVSIQTNLLDSDPAVTVATELAATKVSRLGNVESAHLTDLSFASIPAVVGPDTGSGCFQFQLADAPLAYTEMVHPADFHRSTVDRGVDGTSSIRLSHQLFAQNLEKGVILRSRIRSVFAPAETDAVTSARAYQEFAASEPPLTA